MYTNDHSGSAFTLGLLAGAAIGAGLAILYAPKVGSEVRGQLRQMSKEAMSSLGEMGRSLRQGTERLAERGKDAMTEVAKEGERMFDRATNEASRMANDVGRRTGSSI